MDRKDVDARRAGLRQSLRNPHRETVAFNDEGFDEWVRGLPEEDAESLVNGRAGMPVRWTPGKGWSARRG